MQADDGSTALHRAVAGNCLEVVTELLKKGANTDIKDEFGRNPLALAIDYQLENIASAILKTAECFVCSDGGIENLKYWPCNHRSMACQKCCGFVPNCHICGNDITQIKKVDSDFDCAVCFETGKIRCTLLDCQHKDICYECAVKIKRGQTNNSCPICRQQIRDIIVTDDII